MNNVLLPRPTDMVRTPTIRLSKEMFDSILWKNERSFILDRTLDLDILFNRTYQEIFIMYSGGNTYMKFKYKITRGFETLHLLLTERIC